MLLCECVSVDIVLGEHIFGVLHIGVDSSRTAFRAANSFHEYTLYFVLMRTSIPSDKIHIADYGYLGYPHNPLLVPKVYPRWLFDVSLLHRTLANC